MTSYEVEEVTISCAVCPATTDCGAKLAATFWKVAGAMIS
jgi:hypothetical protein